MIQRPTQFDLRTLGILVFCFSVGLAANVSEVPERMAFLEFIESLPWTFYEVLLTTCATAMVIGLIQQVVLLTKANLEHTADHSSLRFAIVWRGAVAALLAVSLLVEVGINRELLELPERDYWFYNAGWFLPEYLIFGCMILVLTDSLGQYRRVKLRKRSVLKVVLWVFTVLMALYALANSSLTLFWVYKAIAGVEAAELKEFQRPGAYPDFQAEGYWLFWIASSAVMLTIAGAIALVSPFFFRQWSRGRHLFVGGMGLVLLGLSAGFGYWYHFVGFPRISPDFAEAGWSSTWWDWFEAAALLAVAIPALAYRLSVDSSNSIELHFSDQQKPVLHQSLLVTVLLGLAAIFDVFSYFQSLLFDSYASYSVSVFQILIWSVTDTGFYIPLAVTLLSLQLLWKHWKAPSQNGTFCIVRVNPQRVLLASIALVVIIVLSIPTLSAFCFAYWVSPWS